MKSAPSGIITTSHNPSHFLKQISKLLSFCFHNSTRINRGSLNRKELLNYCWNKSIPRLIIVQGSDKEHGARLELYNLELTKNPIEPKIEILNTYFSNNQNPKLRILVKGIGISYTSEIPLSIRKKITTFLTPFIEQKTTDNNLTNLKINFSVNSDNQIYGKVVYYNRKELIELLALIIKI